MTMLSTKNETRKTHIHICKMQVEDVGVKNSDGLTEYANLGVTHILNQVYLLFRCRTKSHSWVTRFN